jgi:hypothetical protein
MISDDKMQLKLDFTIVVIVDAVVSQKATSQAVSTHLGKNENSMS